MSEYAMVEKRMWKEFQAAGLVWWVNRALHLFGWAIVMVVEEDGAISAAYPARCRFRGFDADTESAGFAKLTKHLKDRAAELLEDTKIPQTKDRRIEEIKGDTELLRAMAVRIYNQGYASGHEDTVDGRYIDVLPVDTDTYHKEIIDEILDEAVAAAQESDDESHRTVAAAAPSRKKWSIGD